jgi:hypothetical protein
VKAQSGRSQNEEKKAEKEGSGDLVLSGDNPSNIALLMAHYKNILVCGIKGVGKITNTVTAVKDRTNVCYIGNPLDFEGRRRPGSYDKYLEYIRSLKADIRIIDDMDTLFRRKDEILLIVDEIYGRSEKQLEKISRLFDRENIQIFQIVGCLKNMGDLINKIDVIIELHPDGAFLIDKELGREICRIFGKKAVAQKLPFAE